MKRRKNKQRKKAILKGSLIIIFIFLLVLAGYLAHSLNSREYLVVSREGISVKPAYPSVENEHALVYEAKPGEIIKDSINVYNYFEEPMELIFEKADAYEKENGESVFKGSDMEQSEIGKWLAFDEGITSMEIDGTVIETIDFTLTIPENTPFGEYLGMVGVSYTNSVEEEASTQIASIIRVGTRMYLTVTETPREIEMAEIEAEEGFISKIWLRFIAMSVIIALVAGVFIGLLQTKLFK